MARSRLMVDTAAGDRPIADAERKLLVDLTVEVVDMIAAELMPNFWRPHLARGLVEELEQLEKASETLPARSRLTRELTETTKQLVGLEREAFGLDRVPEEKLAKEIDEMDAARRIAFLFHRATLVQ